MTGGRRHFAPGDYARPILSVAVLFLALATLVTLGHRPRLGERLAPVDSSLDARSRAVLLETCRMAGTDPAALLARTLSRRVGIAGCVERSAFRILLELQSPERIAPGLFALLPVRLEGRPYPGLAAAGQAWFGLPPVGLRAGELALLCEAALRPRGLWRNADDDLARRNHLLAELRARGALGEAALRAETTRPLAVAPDHRPTW